MGFTIFYLSLIVLIPLGAAFLKTFTGGLERNSGRLSRGRVPWHLIA